MGVLLFILFLNIEKRYEIERTGAYFTGKCSQDPAKSTDTSKRSFLALCGDPLTSY